MRKAHLDQSLSTLSQTAQRHFWRWMAREALRHRYPLIDGPLADVSLLRTYTDRYEADDVCGQRVFLSPDRVAISLNVLPYTGDFVTHVDRRSTSLRFVLSLNEYIDLMQVGILKEEA